MRRSTRQLVVAIALGASLALVPARSAAVDNSLHTLGFGVTTQFAGSPDALLAGTAAPVQLSAKIAFQPRVEASLLFGFGVNGTAKFHPGVKLAYVLVPEERMNLYAVTAMSLDLRSPGGVAAFQYLVGPGLELFFPFWPNLGFALEFGFGGSVGKLAKGSDFATVFTGAGSAGIHYYF